MCRGYNHAAFPAKAGKFSDQPIRCCEHIFPEQPGYCGYFVRHAKPNEIFARPCAGNGSGTIIGAVGISGDTSDNDELCAIAGIESAGLKADPGGTKG